jgi:formylmethanofuran dehydrogenase subunit E
MVGKKNIMFIDKKDRKGTRIKKNKDIQHKKSEEMLLVPSLKHKLAKIVLSEKKISFLNTLSGEKPMIHNYKSRRFHRNTIMLNN